MTGTRVLLIEDNRLLREGLKTMLDEQPDLEVVSAVGDADDVVVKARVSKAEIILLDMGLSTQNSLSVAERLKNECPDVRIVVMDLVPTQADIIDFVKAGVSGFVVKDATLDEFLATLRSVAKGQEVLPAQLASSLFSQIVDQAVRHRKASLTASVRMTKREREVIELIADGMSNKEIAQKLNLATHTVKSHVHNILEKLALQTRLEVAAYAYADKPSR